jgi:hypothetical protein
VPLQPPAASYLFLFLQLQVPLLTWYELPPAQRPEIVSQTIQLVGIWQLNQIKIWIYAENATDFRRCMR